jgi:hypothetical protein
MLRQGQADKFWPAAIDNQRVSVGAFIMRFSFRLRRKNDSIQVRPGELRTTLDVIATPEEVIAPRLARLRS